MSDLFNCKQDMPSSRSGDEVVRTALTKPEARDNMMPACFPTSYAGVKSATAPSGAKEK